MAIIKAINSKSSVSHIVNYVADKNKTTDELMYGKDCSSNPDQAIEDMKMTKELYNKEDGRQYKHFVQSFDPQDNITPQKANEIGKEWAEKNFKGYEVFIATHTDKDHMHNHFVVNTVNFETGEKYRQSKADLNKYKEVSDKICEREGLTKTPSKSKEITTFDSKKYKAIEHGMEGTKKSYLVEIGKTVEKNVEISSSKEEFIKNMEKEGYKVKWSDTAKNITYEDKEGHKVRSSNLEKTFKQENFNKEQMIKKFEQNKELEQQKEILSKEELMKKEEFMKAEEKKRLKQLKKKRNGLKSRSVLDKPRFDIQLIAEERNRLENIREVQRKARQKVNEIRKKTVNTLENNKNNEKYINIHRDNIEKLRQDREQLGLFKFKEKKEIDERIKKYQEDIEKLRVKSLPKEEITKLEDYKNKTDKLLNDYDRRVENLSTKIKDYEILENQGKAQEILSKEINADKDMSYLNDNSEFKYHDKEFNAELFLLEEKKIELELIRQDKERLEFGARNEVNDKFVQEDIKALKELDKQEKEILLTYGDKEQIDKRINNLRSVREKEDKEIKSLIDKFDIKQGNSSIEQLIKDANKVKDNKSLTRNDLDKMGYLTPKEKEILERNIPKSKAISKSKEFTIER